MSGYLGSKAASGLFQNIIAIMPPHDTYIETHLGGGAIMKRKPPAQVNIGIDIDSEPLSNFDCEHNVELINGCAHEYLNAFDFSGRELIYVDPPYVAETRTSRNRYRYEYDDKAHIELLTLLNSLPCNVIISGYPSSLYDTHLSSWHSIEVQAMTRGGVRTEKIWFNYELDRLHWATYAGGDFTDRQRIKRKAARWGDNYRNLPKSERLAIMAAIMEVESSETQNAR